MDEARDNLTGADVSGHPPSAIHHPPSRGLHAFAVLLVICVFILLVMGGRVTSNDAALAVPDWPNSYGYNMFLFPPSHWIGGIFLEHTHRLMGSLVGILSLVLAAWVSIRLFLRWLPFALLMVAAGVLFHFSHPVVGTVLYVLGGAAALWAVYREWGRPALQWLAITFLTLVCVQGVMGGLRVTELSINLAILHGITGQLILCLAVLIAAMTSKYWPRRRADALPPPEVTPKRRYAFPARRVALVFAAIVLVQLVLGAIMRHTGAGLAVPDFPTAYGGLIPPFNARAIDHYIDQHYSYNASPMEASSHVFHYPTPEQVTVHFAHRCWALVVVVSLIWLLVSISRQHRLGPHITGPTLALLVMIIAQVTLGALIVLTSEMPEIATAHQALGAVILATAVLLAARLHVLPAYGSGPVRQPRFSGAGSTPPPRSATTSAHGAHT